MLFDKVVVSIEGDTDRVDVELCWAGGFSSRHALYRPVQTYKQLSNYEQLIERIDALRAEGKSLASTADVLNVEGFHPPKRASQFTAAILGRFLRERGVRSGPLPRGVSEGRHLQPYEWWLADLAAELQMPVATMHRWQRVGWVSSRKAAGQSSRTPTNWTAYASSEPPAAAGQMNCIHENSLHPSKKSDKLYFHPRAGDSIASSIKAIFLGGIMIGRLKSISVR